MALSLWYSSQIHYLEIRSFPSFATACFQLLTIQLDAPVLLKRVEGDCSGVLLTATKSSTVAGEVDFP